MMRSATNIITEYWEAAAYNNRIEYFDFGAFFGLFRKAVKDKLAAHGQLSFDEYLSCIDRYYDTKSLRAFEYHGKHSGISVTHKDVLRALFEPRYRQFRRKYSRRATFRKLSMLYKRLLRAPYKSRRDNIILAEQCLHAQHLSGDIIQVDLSAVRDRVEKFSYDPAFGIMTRPALEFRLRAMKYPQDFILLDIDHMHELNKDYGYEVVNRKVRSALREVAIEMAGRWFYGDEILIVPSLNTNIELIKYHFSTSGLTFKYRTIKARRFTDIVKQIGKKV